MTHKRVASVTNKQRKPLSLLNKIPGLEIPYGRPHNFTHGLQIFYPKGLLNTYCYYVTIPILTVTLPRDSRPILILIKYQNNQQQFL